MKKQKIVALIMAVILCLGMMSGCKILGSVTVTFDLNYDGAPEPTKAEVTWGGRLAAPEEPIREMYTFVAWCTDSEGKNQFNFNQGIGKDTTLYASWEANFAPDDIYVPFENTVAFGSFDSDVVDILVGEEINVTFFAEIVSQDYVEDEIAVYEGENAIVVLNDDGVSGDVTADDGVFTGIATLSSDERKLCNYVAKMGDATSESVEICFYEEITEAEFARTQEINEAVSAMTDAESVETYVSGLDEVIHYAVADDERSVVYRLEWGITCVWSEPWADSEIKANSLSVSSSGLSYNDVINRVNERNFSATAEETDVCVVRPYRSTDFPYDDFKSVGDIIADALSSNCDVYDDSAADMDVIKNMTEYGIILWDAHGLLSNFTNAAWTIVDTDPYLMTGQDMSAYEAGNSADWYSERIVVANDWIGGFIGGGRVAVGGKFFEKYYEDDSLEGSVFFLGTCYSAYNDTISSVLIDKGASVVFGFSNISSTTYNNDTLFEIFLNQLLLNGSTAQVAHDEALNVCGVRDEPIYRKYTITTELIMAGDGSYTLVSDTGYVAGKVQDVENNLPITFAKVEFENLETGRVYRDRTSLDGTFKKKLPAGEYEITVSAYSYIDEKKNNIVVNTGVTTYLEDSILLHPVNETKISGKVINALTGEGVSDATIKFRKGMSNKSGDYLTYVSGDIVEITPDETGYYYFDKLPAGYYTAEVTSEGFVTVYRNVVATRTNFDQDISITPELSNEEIRIVLTWGENPNDLDSHLTGPGGIHTWYSSKTARKNGVSVADLDLDDTSSYGPETTTIRVIEPGTYRFYVHKYSGMGSIASSRAQVKVYQGSYEIGTFNAPTDQGTADYWNVFEFDATTGRIIPINTITNSPN